MTAEPEHVRLQARPSWQQDGACRGAHTTPRGFGAPNWFPQRGEPHLPAKIICNTICPVRSDCLAFALENPGDTAVGIWGGMTRRERERQLGHRITLRTGGDTRTCAA